MGIFKLFNSLRGKLKPKRTYIGELRIHSASADKYVGRVSVTTTARSGAEAERNIQNDIRLHIVNVKPIKENLNGHKK
jgi:hypothetical protein